MVAGAVGILLALLSPFLPVDYTKAELTWPQQGSVANVAAPNVSFVPVSMDITVPCTLAQSLPASGGVLLSTVPEGGAEAGKVGLFIRATADSIQVVQRNVVLLNTPRDAAQTNPNCRIVVDADTTGSRGAIEGGLPDTEGAVHRFDIDDPQRAAADHRRLLESAAERVHRRPVVSVHHRHAIRLHPPPISSSGCSWSASRRRCSRSSRWPS